MSKSILIAEDDAFLVKMYKLQLEGAGYDITIATNGKEALESVAKKKPDLLLLDLLMPEMDGFEVLKKLKASGAKFPIVVLSNLSQEIDKEKCVELGAKDFFVKSDTGIESLPGIIAQYV